MSPHIESNLPSDTYSGTLSHTTSVDGLDCPRCIADQAVMEAIAGDWKRGVPDEGATMTNHLPEAIQIAKGVHKTYYGRDINDEEYAVLKLAVASVTRFLQAEALRDAADAFEQGIPLHDTAQGFLRARAATILGEQ